jgi:hypothetical protein
MTTKVDLCDPDGEAFANADGRGGPFPASFDGNDPDPFTARTMSENIMNAGDTEGKYTVPILLWTRNQHYCEQ